MQHKRFIRNVVLAFSLGCMAACASRPVSVTWQPPEEFTETLRCEGSTSGWVYRGGPRLAVRLENVDLDALDRYTDRSPSMMGRCLLVYLDTDYDPAADYCFFVYRDRWTLRKESAPGYFSLVQAEGPVEAIDITRSPGVWISLDATRLDRPIKRTWNFIAPSQ